MNTETIGSEGIEWSVSIPRGRKRRFNAIVNSVNDEGTIQAGDARNLFDSPRNHTTMSLARALLIANFELTEK